MHSCMDLFSVIRNAKDESMSKPENIFFLNNDLYVNLLKQALYAEIAPVGSLCDKLVVGQQSIDLL